MDHLLISDSVARDFLKRAYASGNQNFAELCDELVGELMREMRGKSLSSAGMISPSESYTTSTITITGSEGNIWPSQGTYFST